MACLFCPYPTWLAPHPHPPPHTHTPVPLPTLILLAGTPSPWAPPSDSAWAPSFPGHLPPHASLPLRFCMCCCLYLYALPAAFCLCIYFLSSSSQRPSPRIPGTDAIRKQLLIVWTSLPQPPAPTTHIHVPCNAQGTDRPSSPVP